MKSYPITLGVTRPHWGPVNTKRTTGQISAEADEHVLSRDQYTCRCCGFKAQKYQQVLHINGDPRDFSDDNVLATCAFCYQCFHLEHVAKMGSGMLIWLPEIDQAMLHHLMRSLYIARVAQGALSETARQTYDSLMKRGDEAKKRLGSTDPGALSIVMRDFLPQAGYQNLQKKLEGIRLLPLDRRMIHDGKLEFNQFPQMLAYWRSKTGPFADLPVQDWGGLFPALADGA
jgi:intracellular multiplication protein IcmJ